MYYILKSSPNVGDIVINNHNIEEDTITSIKEGNLINENENYFLEAKNKTGMMTDYISAGEVLIPIVSEKVKDLLSDLQAGELKNSQFIPVKITNHNQSNKAYYILNNIECFDWENSKYTRFPSFLTKLKDFPNKIEKLVFKNDAIGSRNIFRMYERKSFIFASEKVKNIFEVNNISGIEFLGLD